MYSYIIQYSVSSISFKFLLSRFNLLLIYDKYNDIIKSKTAMKIHIGKNSYNPNEFIINPIIYGIKTSPKAVLITNSDDNFMLKAIFISETALKPRG